MSDRIVVEVSDGVADVRLNRPEKMNAVDKAMFDALVQTSASLAEDRGIRAVVLSGEGRAFCAGLDLGSFGAMAESAPKGDSAEPDSGNETAELMGTSEETITHHAQQAVYGFTDLAVPVIVAVHGVALGAGIQLALGGDIRFIAPDAKMSVLEIRWGLIPDMTGTRRLVELIGLDRAKELTWTGRMVEGPEAVELGLATRLADDPHAAAMELAADIAQKSPDAVAAAKRLFREAIGSDDASGFARERHEIGALIGSPNQAESVMAYFEKRAPNFADRADRASR